MQAGTLYAGCGAPQALQAATADAGAARPASAAQGGCPDRGPHERLANPRRRGVEQRVRVRAAMAERQWLRLRRDPSRPCHLVVPPTPGAVPSFCVARTRSQTCGSARSRWAAAELPVLSSSLRGCFSGLPTPVYAARAPGCSVTAIVAGAGLGGLRCGRGCRSRATLGCPLSTARGGGRQLAQPEYGNVLLYRNGASWCQMTGANRPHAAAQLSLISPIQHRRCTVYSLDIQW